MRAVTSCGMAAGKRAATQAAARFLACALCVVAAAACLTPEHATQIVLRVRTDAALGTFEVLETEVAFGDGRRHARSHSGQAPYVATISPYGSLEEEVTVTVRALKAGDAVFATRATVRFQPRHVILLDIDLRQECFDRKVAAACEERGLTCGACSPTCIDVRREHLPDVSSVTIAEPLLACGEMTEGGTDDARDDGGETDAAVADASPGAVDVSDGALAVGPAATVDAGCSDGGCETCPEGFLKLGRACEPMLLELTSSVGDPTPPLSEDETSYAFQLPLLQRRITLELAVADGVMVKFGDRPVAGSRHEVELPTLGNESFVMSLSHPSYGTRGYEIRISRSGSQRAFLKAHNTGASDHFGYATALSNGVIAVGAPDEDSAYASGEDDDADGSGAVYVFEPAGASFEQRAFLKAMPPERGAKFGEAIALDGDTLVVGSPEASGGGAVDLFERTDDGWQPSERLTAGNSATNRFGASLFLQGNFLVVGAPGDSGDVTNAGAIYVFQRSSGEWDGGTRLGPQPAPLAGFFGSRIDCDASRCVVGATGESGVGFIDGAAYVVDRSAPGPRVTARLALSEQQDTAAFGDTVAIAGSWLGVGAFGATSSPETNTSGLVQAFDLEAGKWSSGQRLIADNITAGGAFGFRIALMDDLLLVSAPNEDGGRGGVNPGSNATMVRDSGAVYLFERPAAGEDFAQLARIKADVPGASEAYGISVTMDRTQIVVGAHKESSAATGVDGDASDDSASESGAVYVVR